jgi:hypothetical protein
MARLILKARHFNALLVFKTKLKACLEITITIIITHKEMVVPPILNQVYSVTSRTIIPILLTQVTIPKEEEVYSAILVPQLITPPTPIINQMEVYLQMLTNLQLTILSQELVQQEVAYSATQA